MWLGRPLSKGNWLEPGYCFAYVMQRSGKGKVGGTMEPRPSSEIAFEIRLSLNLLLAPLYHPLDLRSQQPRSLDADPRVAMRSNHAMELAPRVADVVAQSSSSRVAIESGTQVMLQRGTALLA